MENDDIPASACWRPALCLAEFMRFHFWRSEADSREKAEDGWKAVPRSREFAETIVAHRKEALRGLDAGEGGIEFAALVMADAAADRMEKDYVLTGEQADCRCQFECAHAVRRRGADLRGLSRRRAVVPSDPYPQDGEAEETGGRARATLRF